MKRVFLIILAIILLCGCSKQDQLMDRAITLRQKVIASEQISFVAEITADYKDSIYTFSLQCTFDKSGNMTFKVLKPDTISGITGTIGFEGGKLTFDDKALGFELLADGQVSPVSAPWIFMKATRGGYISSCAATSEGMKVHVADSYEEGALQVEIYLDQYDIPTACEILWEGRRFLSVSIKDFMFL